MDQDRRSESAHLRLIRSLHGIPLFGLLVALLLYVFLFAPITVTLDGYSHLYQANILSRMLSGQPTVHAYFGYNSLLVPNWGGTLCLAGLSRVVARDP